VPTYQVMHPVDGSMVVEMEAAHLYAVPTAVRGDHGMLNYAETLMRCKSTVYQIAHRCGPHNRLIRKDGQEEPPSPPRESMGRGVAGQSAAEEAPQIACARPREGKKADVSRTTTGFST
jgi:hypothetical protein